VRLAAVAGPARFVTFYVTDGVVGSRHEIHASGVASRRLSDQREDGQPPLPRTPPAGPCVSGRLSRLCVRYPNGQRNAAASFDLTQRKSPLTVRLTNTGANEDFDVRQSLHVKQ